MRVISGKLGGRRLLSFKAEHIRPTTDRVKETIFNKLQTVISDSRVLDLFSGTGNLAIEAYSRGAAVICAVEKNSKSLRILTANLKNLDISDGIEVVQRDVFAFLQSYKGEAFDIILVDPPFTEKLADQAMGALAVSLVGKTGSVAVIESARDEVIKDIYGSFKLLDRKKFGDKTLSVFEKE